MQCSVYLQVYSVIKMMHNASKKNVRGGEVGLTVNYRIQKECGWLGQLFSDEEVKLKNKECRTCEISWSDRLSEVIMLEVAPP